MRIILLLMTCIVLVSVHAEHLRTYKEWSKLWRPLGYQVQSTVCGTSASSKSIRYSRQTGAKTLNVVSSNGCPGYSWLGQTTPNQARQQNFVMSMYARPVISNKVIPLGVTLPNGTANTNPVMGPIGLSINGVAIYGNSDANRRDAYIYESQTFDACKGHPDMSGTYHYHAEPGNSCVYSDTIGQHSPLFGFMADGIPIYGVKGDNGATPTDLDSCGGHTDNTYNFYHYHLQSNYTYPYTINCLKGCVTNTSTFNRLLSMYENFCQQASVQYDYSSLDSMFTTTSSAM